MEQTKKMKTIEQRLQTIEELLLLIIPWHKLTPEQRDRMSVPEKLVEIDAGERKRIVRNEFLRMVTATPSVRIAARYPRCLIPKPGEDLLAVAPLSILVNRCKARKAFAPLPGEESSADNVMRTFDDLGIVTATLEDLGLARFSQVQVVLNKDTRSRFNPVKWGEEEQEEEEEEGEEETVPHKKGAKEPEPEDEEDEPAPSPIRKKKDDGISFDWSSVGKEESFEESEAAQGVATIPSRDSLDGEEEEIEDEDLSDTVDVVDDDWGPDEIEFDNPVREQFEREAEEAAAREQAKLDSGEYFLLDGKVTKKKGR